VAGRITTFVFDKTGTLTEDSLSVLGFRVSQNVYFDNGLEIKTSSVFTKFISES